MNKLYQMMCFSCLLSLSACSTIEVTMIDFLTPADISFPEEIKKVGVVNNVSDTDGDAKIATEALANAIADGNYFDKVVISDSVLRAGDYHPRETMLSQNEVKELTQEMEVDLIVSLEQLDIRFTRHIQFYPEWGTYHGVIDALVSPMVRLYIPNRAAPLVMINPQDSIFWEEEQLTENSVRANLPKEEKLVEESSEFAGALPVRYFIPYWDSDRRFYFDGGGADMRDAGVFLRKNAWEKAYGLWKEVYDSGKKKKKMLAAHNIALYYEVEDDPENAELWINRAVELGKEIGQDTENYFFIRIYQGKLAERKAVRAKLNMQMNRFE